MDDLKRGRLVLDNAGRDLVSIRNGATDREWHWATTDGKLVAKAGTLSDIGSGRYQFDGVALDLRRFTGRKGTEADLLADIGTALGWHMPEPV